MKPQPETKPEKVPPTDAEIRAALAANPYRPPVLPAFSETVRCRKCGGHRASVAWYGSGVAHADCSIVETRGASLSRGRAVVD